MRPALLYSCESAVQFQGQRALFGSADHVSGEEWCQRRGSEGENVELEYYTSMYIELKREE